MLRDFNFSHIIGAGILVVFPPPSFSGHRQRIEHTHQEMGSKEFNGTVCDICVNENSGLIRVA